ESASPALAPTRGAGDLGELLAERCRDLGGSQMLGEAIVDLLAGTSPVRDVRDTLADVQSLLGSLGWCSLLAAVGLEDTGIVDRGLDAHDIALVVQLRAVASVPVADAAPLVDGEDPGR